uniref:Uncharacterized protein n=1 Tax=Alexandrium monilatum TaxID=311494 RepID=A0A7S4VYK8_9DINO|mmetsp:Transcript_38243/g.118940  ORF Transcript_38243/g.118940 Transcript_38243/m.118940 type:complete len:357 (-) Transcript_38243:286-1356(-)
MVRRTADDDGQVKLFSFFEELAEPVKKVAQTAWASRGKLARDVKAYALLVSGMVWSMPGRAAKVVNNPKLHALLAEEEDPEALAAVVFGIGGALCVGSVGVVVGIAAGGAAGAALGALPALFTLGLSLPLGALAGSAGGASLGLAAGGSAGFVGGATSGSAVAYFRRDIRHCAVHVASRVHDAYDLLVARPVAAVQSTTRRVRETAHASVDRTRVRAKAVGDAVTGAAADRCVQVTATSAGAGALALGTAGAASGAMVGGATGVLVGLVPALFTFGLSIPVGAVVGAGAGVCAGGAAGTAVGFAGGGVAGCLSYRCRDVPGAVLRSVRGGMRAVAGGALVVGTPDQVDQQPHPHAE